MDQIIEKYPKIIREKLKAHIKKIILFGSRARGDFDHQSDYDFALIVDERSHAIKDMIMEINGAMLDEYDLPIGSLIWDEADWEFHKRFPIGINIIKDGIEL